MTNTQILKKAIEKAVENGWKFDNEKLEGEKWLANCYARVMGKRTVFYWWSFSIIFSHPFAKAFFGEKNVIGNIKIVEKAWVKHLQTMVLEKDPIKYLEKFL